MPVRPSRSSGLILIAAILLATVLMLSGTDATLDRLLSPLRAGIVHRSASGRVAVVEMDAASAAAIRRWPWSRVNYAIVVDRLREAGAASIVFDVDLSSTSDGAGDRAFAAALRRSNGLVALPTFGQAAGSTDRRTIDALPLPQFRDHVALASVSILPDADGQIRSMPFGTMTFGIPRPSLSSYIAAQSGAADTQFAIDMSIDPASVPRLSFVAVRDGRFDPAMVRGRSVLIGATAVEMGDRYSTPAWGVLPGVVIQALAAETLLRGTPLPGGWPIPALLAAAAIVAILRAASTVRIVAGTVAALGGTLATVLVAQHVFLTSYPLATAMLIILSVGAGCLVRQMLRTFRSQRMTDEETGLPNGRAFLVVPAATGSVVAVADIGNFDGIVAVLGATVAASLIGRVAERLALVAEEARIYRIADRQLAFRSAAATLDDDALEAIRVMMLQPIEVGGRRIDVGITIGVADGGDERALANAALAATEASAADTFWRHAAADLTLMEQSMSLMGELDDALVDGGIDVFYQPKYDLRAGRITSAEALVRWRHLDRGFIGPDLFIPLAESSNRIGPLTLYVIERVMRDVAGWQLSLGNVTAAINISAKLLSSADFNTAVEQLLATIGVRPASLIFEVTESAAMSDPDAAVAALRRYRALGIAVSMDDYGTGQSTLTYLRQLPLSELKIDRSFVQHAHENHADASLVRSTIDLAHELGLKVVAEGVEVQEGLVFLRSCGCDLVQGYLISRPLPLELLIHNHGPAGTGSAYRCG